MRLLVKGEARAAVRAAQDRGIYPVGVWARGERETTIQCEPTPANVALCAAWLCEPPYPAPYPAGTLLFYR